MNTLTVLAKIKPGREDLLRRLLEEVGNDIKRNPYVRFTESEHIHFARWAILHDEDNGPRLLFSTNYDGTLQSHIKELIKISPGIDQVWGKCRGYRGKDDFPNFIRKHSYPAQAVYVGFPGETVQSIRNYAAIREQIERFLDLDDVVRFVNQDGITSFLDKLSKLRTRRSHRSVLEILKQAIISLLHTVFLRSLVWAATTYARFGQSSERTRVISDCEDESAHKQQVEHAVDTVTLDEGLVQNQMTVLTAISPGQLPFLRFALAVSNILHEFGYPPGEFANVATLHSFYWVIIDKGKRIIFMSTFDGSWQNYMGDFIDKLEWGLDAIYKSTVGYPKAGMKDSGAFTEYILARQAPAQVFYSAYPQQTVPNIIQQRQLCGMLAAHFDREAIEEWLTIL